MIRAKKSLGQNFLIDKDIINKIVSTVSITDNEILEVGPGTGNLTKEILRKITAKSLVKRERNYFFGVVINSWNNETQEDK